MKGENNEKEYKNSYKEPINWGNNLNGSQILCTMYIILVTHLGYYRLYRSIFHLVSFLTTTESESNEEGIFISFFVLAPLRKKVQGTKNRTYFQLSC